MKHPLMTAMTVAAAILMGSALVAGAQENYPSKPIRVIVPEVVGSAADLMSRIIGQQISQALGQRLRKEAGGDQGIIDRAQALLGQALQGSAHAVAECMVRAPKLGKDALIIVNLSGRGDKDVAQVADKVGLQMPK